MVIFSRKKAKIEIHASQKIRSEAWRYSVNFSMKSIISVILYGAFSIRSFIVAVVGDLLAHAESSMKKNSKGILRFQATVLKET